MVKTNLGRVGSAGGGVLSLIFDYMKSGAFTGYASGRRILTDIINGTIAVITSMFGQCKECFSDLILTGKQNFGDAINYGKGTLKQFTTSAGYALGNGKSAASTAATNTLNGLKYVGGTVGGFVQGTGEGLANGVRYGRDV